MNKIKIAFFLTLLISLSLNAQKYAPIEDTDVLKKQTEVLKTTHPNLFSKAEIDELMKTKDDFTLVKYTKGGTYYETIVNSGRKDMLLIETAMEINSDELPKVVGDAFKSDHPNASITKRFKTQRPDGEIRYRIDYKEKDKTRSRYFDDKGRFAKKPLK